MNRRGFLQGIIAAGVAPAFVGSSILMPVKKLWTPSEEWVAFDPAFKDETVVAYYMGNPGQYRKVGNVVTVQFSVTAP